MQSYSQTTSDKDSNLVIFYHFDSISRLIQFIFMMDQITYVIHQLHYNIYLVYIFQLTIMYECKVIHKQPSIRTRIRSFLTIFKCISRLIQFIFMMYQITYVIHQLHFNIYLVYKFQLTIMNECKVIHKQPPIRTQIRSFFAIFDSIS